ncbi:MAG: hypothetical protein LUE93_05865, partial [Bacteroides sp.]|nr:hypothetical protein [Bacteroides sp.]
MLYVHFQLMFFWHTYNFYVVNYYSGESSGIYPADKFIRRVSPNLTGKLGHQYFLSVFIIGGKE